MSSRVGVALGLTAYVLWGLFPLYFPLMAPAGPLEILAHRIVWSLVFCVVATTALQLARRGGWAAVVGLARAPRTLALLVCAAVAIAVNWGVYILATNTGHVVEASLGYFINPLLTVLLAVLVLRERLRPLQWTAIGIGAASVVVLSVEAGTLPWISLVLATSFGAYGLLKNRIGRARPGGTGSGSTGAGGAPGLDALSGLTAETLVLALPAAVALVVLEARGGGHFTAGGPWHPLLLVSTGLVTAVPLLLFAGATRRVSLTATGLMQYVTPVLQLLCGVLLLGEHVTPGRWVGFAGVWLALVVLSADLVLTGRRSRAHRRGLGVAAASSA